MVNKKGKEFINWLCLCKFFLIKIIWNFCMEDVSFYKGWDEMNGYGDDMWLCLFKILFGYLIVIRLIIVFVYKYLLFV